MNTLEQIISFIEGKGYTKESDTLWTRTFTGQPSTIVFNGQQTVVPGRDRVSKIYYRGEGSIQDINQPEDKCTILIYGFDIELDGALVGMTEYVETPDQFRGLFGF